MVSHPLSGDPSTPQQRRPSDPMWSVRRSPAGGVFTSPGSTLQTPPCSGKQKSKLSGARYSPYMTPERTVIVFGDGRSCPLSDDLFTPKEHMEAVRQRRASATPSPMTSTTQSHAAGLTNTMGRARPAGYIRKPPLFPPNSGVQPRNRSQSPAPRPKLVSPPVQGIPRKRGVRRPLEPTRPTVQLLRVLNKCWDDDGTKLNSWTVSDGLLNGCNDERDRSGMWNTLQYAVSGIWPELREWIMRNTPSDDDATWFRSVDRIGDYDGECIYDPNLGTKDSSLDHVGFQMSPSMYSAACNVIQGLGRRGSDLGWLLNEEINPFFVIYACADCNIPLPGNFNRQLLWKHLDAILRARCWRGLGSARAKARHDTSADTEDLPPKLYLSEDPDDILQTLLRRSCRENRFGPKPAPSSADAAVPRRVHKLQIVINDYEWIAKAEIGTVWYRAGDLYDEDDIACLAIIDSLTRLLPSCQGGILEISSRDIRLLWGVGGEPSGAWFVVQSICEEYRVKLQAKWIGGRQELELNFNERVDPATIRIPPRNRDVVDAVLKEFERMRLGDSKAAYQCMMDHFRVTTEPSTNSSTNSSGGAGGSMSVCQ